jgi:hypothetical protein
LPGGLALIGNDNGNVEESEVFRSEDCQDLVDTCGVKAIDQSRDHPSIQTWAEA